MSIRHNDKLSETFTLKYLIILSLNQLFQLHKLVLIGSVHTKTAQKFSADESPCQRPRRRTPNATLSRDQLSSRDPWRTGGELSQISHLVLAFLCLWSYEYVNIHLFCLFLCVYLFFDIQNRISGERE